MIPEGFRDGYGNLNDTARIAHRRLMGDALYLSTWREVGHAEAAKAACGTHGHLPPRGGRCERCGAGVVQMRDERLYGR